MILCSIQSEAAYQAALNKGVLRADWDYIFLREEPAPYLWMAEKLSEKSPKPDERIVTPIWAWFQWRGKRKRRDLRYSGCGKRGEAMVRLTIEMPDERVLLSDFMNYNSVLMNDYIPDSEEDSERFDQEMERAGITYADLRDGTGDDEIRQSFQAKIIQSWDKIFDIESIKTDYSDSEDQSIQAVMWEVKISEIIKVERFIAR